MTEIIESSFLGSHWRIYEYLKLLFVRHTTCVLPFGSRHGTVKLLYLCVYLHVSVHTVNISCTPIMCGCSLQANTLTSVLTVRSSVKLIYMHVCSCPSKFHVLHIHLTSHLHSNECDPDCLVSHRALHIALCFRSCSFPARWSLPVVSSDMPIVIGSFGLKYSSHLCTCEAVLCNV